MRIFIYYRHAAVRRLGGKARPQWFSHEMCFANLLGSLVNQTTDAEIHLRVVFDGSEQDLAEDFTPGYLASNFVTASAIANNIRLHRVNGGTQLAAWMACLEVAAPDIEAADPEDLFYFLENDYLHEFNWVSRVVDLVGTYHAWGYLALYDHFDKYPNLCTFKDAPLYRSLKSKIVVSNTSHWRVVPSTCWTFIVRRKTLQRDMLVFRNPLGDRYTFPILTTLLRRELLTPMPSLSTHSMEHLLAPCVDWNEIADQTRSRFMLG